MDETAIQMGGREFSLLLASENGVVDGTGGGSRTHGIEKKIHVFIRVFFKRLAVITHYSTSGSKDESTLHALKLLGNAAVIEKLSGLFSVHELSSWYT
jgi:hypothetical protein